jgi:hypothetical protein
VYAVLGEPMVRALECRLHSTESCRHQLLHPDGGGVWQVAKLDVADPSSLPAVMHRCPPPPSVLPVC